MPARVAAHEAGPGDDVVVEREDDVAARSAGSVVAHALLAGGRSSVRGRGDDSQAGVPLCEHRERGLRLRIRPVGDNEDLGGRRILEHGVDRPRHPLGPAAGRDHDAHRGHRREDPTGAGSYCASVSGSHPRGGCVRCGPVGLGKRRGQR